MQLFLFDKKRNVSKQGSRTIEAFYICSRQEFLGVF